MASERQVKVTILGEDKGGAKALQGVEAAAAKTGPSVLNADKSLGQLTSTLTSRLPVGGAQAKSMLDGLGGSLKQMPPLALAGAGAVLALGAGLAKAASDGIDKFESQTAEVRKLKAALGSTAEEASQMRNVAVGLGVDTDSLSKGIFKLSTNLVKTGGDFAGVHVETAKNADGTTNLVKTVDNLRATYQSLHDPVQKNVFLQQALSKGGLELRGILSANNAEYDKMKNRGPIYSDKDLKSARDLAIAQREMGASVDKLETDLARGLVPIMTSFANVMGSVTDHVDSAVKSHGWLGVAIRAVGETAKNTLTFGLDAGKKSTKDSGDAAAQATAQFQEQSAALKDMGADVSDLELNQKELNKENKAAVAQAEKYKQTIDELGSSVSRAYLAVGNSADTLSDKERDQAKAFDTAKASADQLKQGLDILTGVHITATRAAIDWEVKIKATTDALATNGHTLNIHTVAGQANTSAILDMIQAAESQIDALGREGASTAEVSAAYQDHVQALRNVMSQAGFTKDEIDKLLGQYNLLANAPNVDKTITTHNVVVNSAQDNYNSNLGAGRSYFEASGGMVGQRLAAGGMNFAANGLGLLGPGGGRPHGPTIVSEGGYDEFVITEDPRYRGRNQLLAAAAAKAVGLYGLAGGGVTGWGSESASDRQSYSALASYGPPKTDENSFVQRSMGDPNRGQPGYRQADDGSWVPVDSPFGTVRGGPPSQGLAAGLARGQGSIVININAGAVVGEGGAQALAMMVRDELLKYQRRVPSLGLAG